MATGRIGVTPTLGTRWSKAPAGGTTSLSGLDDNSVSLVYSVGYEQVYRNGVLLSRGNDYTATTGNSITLIDATIAGDIIEVFANELVPLTDAISKGQFTAKGALLSATAASTPAVLTVGSNDQVLTADSTTSTGLKWATPSSSTYVQLATGTLSSTTVSITSISGSYTDLRLWVYGVAVGSNEFYSIRVNSNTGSIYKYDLRQIQTATVLQSNGATSWNELGRAEPGTNNFILLDLYNYASTTLDKMGYINTKRAADFFAGNLAAATTSAISSIQLIASGGQSFSAGTYVLYGVK